MYIEPSLCRCNAPRPHGVVAFRIKTSRSSIPKTRTFTTVASTNQHNNDNSMQNNQLHDRSSRRDTLKAIVAGISSVGVASATVLPASAEDERRGEIYHTDAEWRQLLTPEQYAVLRQAATEKRFSSPLVNEHRKGVFCCAACGSELYLSNMKYESGTGWPSFFDCIPGSIEKTVDNSIPFMTRIECRCNRCKSHNGHVFPDGPDPTGLRYCMNGLALTFRPDESA